ncbi:hypothetical protein NVP1121O_036 [Vibrio phage 1.121.O._10N.286.46.C4]|nr:hypothetical protein NVP1121O_036 [Vibrio phage 1.121.O._10N.286.46.C4]
MPKRIRCVNLIDIQGKRTRSLQSMQAMGDWQFIQLGHHTSANPWSVTQGTKAKLTFQPEDITFSAGRDLELNYDFTNQSFNFQNLDDVFSTEIRFKCRCTNQNGHADVSAEIPNFGFNPIAGQTFGIPKGAGVEQFVTLSGIIFVGQDLLDGGFEVFLTSGGGDFEVYDISMLSCKISSNV